MQRAVERASHGEYAVHALDDLTHVLRGFESHRDVDPSNDHHAFVGLDFSGHVSAQLAAACVYMARFQRASECSNQSTSGRGDHVVDRRGV